MANQGVVCFMGTESGMIQKFCTGRVMMGEQGDYISASKLHPQKKQQ